MAATRISVLVPCYNLGIYLDEAVESALAQGRDDIEIIVVDDGSTDPETRRVLSDYRRPKTRLIRTENRGLARARNLAISEASGEYLCALDADDRLAPGYFDRAVALLDTNPSLTFVSSWLRMFGDEERVWKQERCDLAALLAECTVCTAALVRRSAVLEIGGYDENMPAQGYEDWDLWLGLVERGHRGVILPEVMFHYRRRAGSMSSICCEGDTHLELWRYLLSKHRASYEAHLFEVLGLKDAEMADWLRGSRELEGLVDGYLAGRLARRERELARLEARLRAADGAAADGAHSGRLEAQLAAARRDLDAVLRSRSWRLTAPLRGLLHRLRGVRT